MSRIDHATLEQIKAYPDLVPMLKRLAEGASTVQVAREFYIAPQTVDYRTAYLRNALGGIRKTAPALAMAASLGLITCTDWEQASAAKRWRRVAPLDRLITELLAYGFTTKQVAAAVGRPTKSMEFYIDRIYRTFSCRCSRNVLLSNWAWATGIRLDEPTSLELGVLRHVARDERLGDDLSQLTRDGINVILHHLAAKLGCPLTDLIAAEQRSIA